MLGGSTNMNKKKIMALLMAVALMTPSTVFAAPFTIEDNNGVVHEFETADFSDDAKIEEFKTTLGNADFEKVFVDLNNDNIAVTLDQIMNRPDGDFLDFENTNQGVDLDTVVNAKAEVKGITLINLSKIKVEFTAEVAEIKAANFSADGLTFTNAVLATDGLSAEVTVKGAKFKESKEITLKDVKDVKDNVVAEYTSTVEFGDVNDYYTIEFEFDCEDSNGDGIVDIEASGATNTQVTAIVKDKEGNIIEDAEGVMKFTKTIGGIAQPERTITNGKAAVNLTSVASLTEDKLSDIFATIVGNSTFEGLVGKTKVQFLAPGGDADPDAAVPVVNVESNQADRVYITLGQPKPELTDKNLDDIARNITVTDGIAYDNLGKNIKMAVKEVKQISSKVLEVIFDTENGEINHLTDNAKHTVEFTSVSGIMQNGKLSFNLTDTTKLFVLDVKSENQNTLVVKYSEPVAWNTDGTLEDYDANNPANYLIDGDPLLDTKANHFDLDETRKVVTIKLQGKDRLTKTDNNIEIHNVGDWAGITDSNNCISTQTFDYDVIIDDSIPTMDVERQSPEQFLITFTTPVTLTQGTLEEAVQMYYGDKNETTKLRATQYDTDAAAAGTDGVKFSAYLGDVELDSSEVTNPTSYTFDRILVELEADWTVEDGTGNGVLESYWTKDPIQFTIAKDMFITNIGNKTKALDKDVINDRDRLSPDIIEFEQDKNDKHELLNTATMVMTEPIQVLDKTNPLTPNEEQNIQNGGVQTGEIKFEKDGVVVDGIVNAISGDDYTAQITPNDGTKSGFEALRAATKEATGEWIVSITGFSDDYGNTMDTQEFTFNCPQEDTVAPTEKIEVEPEVMYAEYVNGDDYDQDIAKDEYDVIRVKFTEAMSNSGAVAVGDTTNYTLNGHTLADLGSSIRKGINEVTNEWDGMTILLPKDTIKADANFVLNVADNLQSADGQRLTGENELDLVDTDKATEGTTTSTYNASILLEANVKNLKVDGIDASILQVNNTTGSSIILKDVIPSGATKSVKAVDKVIVKLDTTEALSAKVTDYQVRINDELVTVNAIDDTAKTITIIPNTAVKEEQFKAESGDRIEVTINGQTILVKTY
jgi:hypothetical protein